MSAYKAAERPQRNPLVNQTLASLRLLIEELPYGARLPSESQLAEELGVGRSTVREAVRVLAHLGLVEARQGSGTYVCEPVPSDLQRRMHEARADEVFEARSELESAIARLAAARRSAKHLKDMKGSLQRCRRAAAAGDVEAFLAADNDFHTAVVVAAGNSVLADIYSDLRASHAIVASVIAPYVDLGQAVTLHDAVLDAINAKDPDAADAATRHHLADTWTGLQAAARAGS